MIRPRFSTLLIAALVLLPMMALAPVKNAGVIQEHDFPPALSPGEEQVVNWSLDIHGCEGFARFQIQFPKGLSAEPRETANASYSFEDGKAKFIWMELPAQSTLQVALTVKASADFSGGAVTQWFSFIQNGSRKDIEFEPHHVARRSGSPLTEAEAEAAPTSSLQVQRSWNQTSANAGTMTVHISGHESGQFLKLTETIGSYQSLSVIEDNECQIRDAFDGKLVCIWQAAPTDDPIEVRYTLNGGQPEQIQGTVSTVLGDSPQEAAISPLPSPEPSPAPVVVASAEPEISFRVQVLATRSEASTNAVRRIYAFPGELRVEQHNDWHKFTTGYFTTYRSARDNRVELRANHTFPGPFVTAYQNGKRITVQEALLVTKQNWIP